MTNRSYIFRNLVFQGGGMKMLAYHGVLEVLEEAGILQQIDRVAGASSGSLTAMLVSLGLTAAETIELFRTVDYSRIPDNDGSDGDDGDMTAPYAAAESAEHGTTRAASDRAESAQAHGENEQPLWELLPAGPLRDSLLNLPASLRAVTRLVNQHGWYSSRHMHRSISEIIKSQCGEAQATFADFRRQERRDLYVVATNLSRRRVEVFSAETTPDVAVADALLLSQSIPLFFAAPRFDGRSLGAGDTYTDGGVLDNYPLQLFDEPRHVAQREHFVDGVNRETLGCRFYTPDHCQEHADIGTLIDYAVNLFFTMNAAEDIAYAANPTAQARTVEISNCCVASTDFDLEPSPDDARYAALVAAGREAMQAYLEAYQP